MNGWIDRWMIDGWKDRCKEEQIDRQQVSLCSREGQKTNKYYIKKIGSVKFYDEKKNLKKRVWGWTVQSS